MEKFLIFAVAIAIVVSLGVCYPSSNLGKPDQGKMRMGEN